MNLKGNTPLCSAASSEGIRSLKVLIELGANKESKNNEGETPLLMAAKYGHFECLEALIKSYSANIFAENNKNEGILEITIDYMKKRKVRNLKIFEFLLENTNYVSSNGNILELTKKIQNKIKKKKKAPFWICFYQKLKQLGVLPTFDYLYLKNLILSSEERFIAKDLLSIWREQLLEEQVRELGHIFIFESIYDEDLLKELHRENILEVDTASFFKHLSSQSQMSETFVLRCLKHLKIAFITYRDEENKNFFHLFVKHRMTEVIVDLLNIAAKGLTEQNMQLLNPELLNLMNQEKMKAIFLDKDKSNINFKDLALLKKYLDINLILENFASTFLGMAVNSSFSFSIPKYEIAPKKLSSEQLEAFHSHSKKAKLEEMNDFLEKSDNKSEAPQYRVLNPHDLKALEEFNERKKNLEHPVFTKFIADKLKAGLKFIDSIEGLEECAQHLEEHQVIGVDLEFYGESFDSSLGLICTLQLSTVEKNFILDSLRLREKIKIRLKNIFESENFIKVFHSPETDFKFLKADLDFNVVNHFDTNTCAMILMNKTNSLSLAAIALQTFEIPVDKAFQVSDWRIRPLPEPMLEYAKNDANILIYLFFHYKKLLGTTQLEKEVAIRCNNFSIRKLEKNFLKSSEIRFLE